MICNKCGNELKIDTSVILTSHPPKYKAYCPVCDEHTYVYCADYYGQPKFETVELGKWTREELVKLGDGLC